MDEASEATAAPQPVFDMDAATAHHEQNASLSQEDTMKVARLFNNIGSELTNIDRHNIGDGKPAMKLDKNAVLQSAPPPPPRPGPPPPHAGVPQQVPVPPAYSQPHVTNQPVISVPHNQYERDKKVISSLKRKITKLEKDIKSVNDILNVPNSVSKYKIVTDDVDCVCSNVHTLVNVFTAEISKKPGNISITKC